MSVSLKDIFKVTHSCPTNKRHVSPYRATERTPGFNEEAEGGANYSFRLEPILEFLRKG